MLEPPLDGIEAFLDTVVNAADPADDRFVVVEVPWLSFLEEEEEEETVAFSERLSDAETRPSVLRR